VRVSPNEKIDDGIDEAVLDRRIDIAYGHHAKSKEWINYSFTVEKFLSEYGKFSMGRKDGPAIIQGKLGAGGGQRLAQFLVSNDLLILDLDNGAPLDEVVGRVRELGLFAVVWSTYSHMRPTTGVTERELTKWAAANKITLGYTDEEVYDHCVDYLTTAKNKRPWLFRDVAGSVKREMTDKGVSFTVTHQPCPRFRVMFVLDKPFDFMAGLKKERDDEWKQRYAAFADGFMAGWDRACTDPARLMYLPRVPDLDTDLGSTEFQVIAGRMVDIERDGALIDDDNPFLEDTDGVAGRPGDPRHSGKGGVSPHFKPATPGLMEFVSQHKDLDVISLMRDYGEGDERGHNNDDLKMEFCCPFEEHHTNQDPNQTAFFMAVTPGETWNMHCQTDGCKQRSGGDRLVFLDALMQKYQIPPLMLKGYSVHAQQEGAERLAKIDAEAAEKKRVVLPQFEAITKESHLDDIRACLDVIARQDSAIERADLMEILAEKSGKKKTVLDQELKRVERARREAAAEGTRAEWPGDPTKVVEVWSHWDWTDIVAGTYARFTSQNWKAPKVFIRPGVQGTCHIRREGEHLCAYPMTAASWDKALADTVVFKGLVDGEVRGVQPFPTLRSTISGTFEPDLPKLLTVSQIATFAPDGTLPLAECYVPSTQTYFIPNYTALPVPDVVTEDQLDEAFYWLTEAIRDFPFTDTFGGSDALPVKSDVQDEDGYWEPNWDRGVSSRAHAIALMLQPFARGLIDGPTPAFHIDKAAAGTGAGYLANVIFTIATGRPAAAQTLSPNPEEMAKAVTATLREAAPVVFFDNINHHVDSAELASAMTTGIWKARILGQSELTTLDIRATWIFTGNNVTFTSELIRRLIPIRIDAATADPAADRGKGDFKHFPLQSWLVENRARLVWAAQVIIRNWFQQGKPSGDRIVNSFDEWSRVMGGILKAAKIPGFLDNLNTYREALNNERDSDVLLVTRLAEKHGGQTFTATEALDALRGLGEEIPPEFEIGGNTERGQMVALGHKLRKLLGKTFSLDAGMLKMMPKVDWPTQPKNSVPVYTVALAVRKSHNVSQYHFAPVAAPTPK
jgi:hypothetical protein